MNQKQVSPTTALQRKYTPQRKWNTLKTFPGVPDNYRDRIIEIDREHNPQDITWGMTKMT